jgi:hypothetical protein
MAYWVFKRNRRYKEDMTIERITIEQQIIKGNERKEI